MQKGFSVLNAAVLVASVTLLAFVIDFVRRNLLKEKYSILWLGLSVAVITLSLSRGLLDRLAAYVGIAYPPSLLFIVALLFVMLILLHFSVVLSILNDKNKLLMQEIAMLKSDLDEHKSRLAGRDAR